MAGGAGDGSESLTFDLRGLVWAIESEVSQLTAVCRRIDDHVRAVNAARRDAAERLLVLDALVEAAEDDDVRTWLERVTVADLPTLTEVFPDRLYAD